MDQQFASAAAYELVQDALLSPQEKIRILIHSLPVLTKDHVTLDDSCPICLVPFSLIFQEEADNNEDLGGLTKLLGCGHIFCRRDLTEWIQSHHGSCPTCRHTFLDIRPRSESDDESSDGGEYIPNADDFDDEDEDAFLDTDGFSEADADDEFQVGAMELDFGDIWQQEQEDAGDLADAEMDDEDGEWGLTDGESEVMSSSSSDADTTTGEEDDALEAEVNVSVHEDDEANGEEGEGVSVNPDDSALEDPK